MAVEARPIEVDNVRAEERLLGGDVVWWAFLLVVSVPIMLFGLAQAPQIHGFLLLTVGGIAAGTAFAQVMLRLQFFTRRFLLSIFLVVVAAFVIVGVAQLYSMTLPVPQASLDVMYKPPISGG
ncbi:MAG: hypothetical protein LC797_22340 [Chloroflexi bacterium]|nr:hypothetical protein [Chloroflexota bacterium]